MNQKSDQELESMRIGGAMLARVLQLLSKSAVAGITPKELSALANRELKALGGEPAFLGVEGDVGVKPYPDIICISVNDQVQHSIPTDIPLQSGDVVNFDFGVRYQGMITDAGITVGVGKLSEEDTRLITTTAAALDAAINVVKAGVRVGTVSATIQAVLERGGLGIVRELVGHGVGHDLHEDPEIPNYGHRNTGPKLREGMTIAIEPITTLGRHGIYIDWDGWTIRTEDKSKSAQFEHTLLVTKTGCEVLTTI
jgi:methionyl aminopeptidase